MTTFITIFFRKNQAFSSHENLQGSLTKSYNLLYQSHVEMIMDNVHRFKVIKRIENPDYTLTWLHFDTKGHHKGIRIFNP